MEFQRNADPPARETHASPAAARDDVTAPLIAASCSASTANPAPLIWGDSELAEMDDNDAFTVVRTKKRRRDSPVLPAMAAQSNSAGASRRQRSSTGWIPPVKEIRTTTAHVMEARARQASCTEEQCLFLEYCPDYQSYQYLRAIEKVVGGPKNIFQFSKINGHYLLGLASKSLAEHLVREGLEIEGTLIRTFPFRKSSTRITVGNLPFFVADAAIIDALSRYGRITSIAPKLLKAGEFTYTDGRREAFILLHDGITIDKLPTRFEIRIKGEAWPAFLCHGIKCSKCHGQGHRRANCPQLHGRSTTARRASPPPSTDLPPSTAPGLPRQSSAAPPAPAPPSPSNKASRAPSDSCAASLPSAAPWPSTPAPPASSMQAVTPAPPPMTPSPEDPMGPRSAASRPEPTPPARPDFTTPCGPLPAQGTLGPATLTSDVDMTTTEETSASSPAAVISTLPLPAPRPAEPMLPTTYREELTPPLMTPPPAPRLAGPIPPVPHGDTTTPAMTTPPPPLSMDRRWKMAGDLIHGLSREIDLEHTFQSQVDIDDIVRAVLYPGDREPFIKRLPTRDRYILGGFISTAIWRARDADPSMLESDLLRPGRSLLRPERSSSTMGGCCDKKKRRKEKQRSSFDQLSEFDRKRIVAYRDCGLSFREIGSRVGRNQTTVMRICDLWMQEVRIAGTLNSQRYISKVLEPVVLPYLQGLPTAIFPQDNARPHVTHIVQRFFVNRQIELLPWPARSLDLSPIENMWFMVAQRLTQITSPAATPDQLWQRVETAWSAVPQEHIQSLFESMPRRVTAVISNNGSYSGY
ncbi:hypothetical protein LAZ67_7002704 [Cordylochernes scorpioides]|uniref:Transposase IS30-like HTH domain-containing protein n=1 Tax=Cordylochernes scorpioides TaxID=51811 RepID=A0ABY6KRA1_9ARAC|nr:hypothetical protein LAZ67_7002704 [Cordylochernes scorpioides]